MNSYNINGKTLKFKVCEFEGKLSKNFYENQIYKTLLKIGITKDFIRIDYLENGAIEVVWEINKQSYIFHCNSQNSRTKNLGAISQAIQDDIRQITRGIKDFFMVMSQYEEKEKKIAKRKGLLDFGFEKAKKEKNVLFDINEIKSNIPIDEKLDKKYYYLTKLSDDKLNSYYQKLKEECIKSNKLDHPMFKALKIILYDRNLKL